MNRIEALEAHNIRAQAFQAHIDKYRGQNIAAQTGISQVGHIEYKIDCLTSKVNELTELVKQLYVQSEADNG